MVGPSEDYSFVCYSGYFWEFENSFRIKVYFLILGSFPLDL
jgi:hypothetical protein